MRPERGGEESSGVHYVFGPQAVLDRQRGKMNKKVNKEEKADTTSERERVQIDGKTDTKKNLKIQVHIGEAKVKYVGQRGAVSGLRIILLFTGLQGLSCGDCVCDPFSGFREMCPCVLIYWRPHVGTGA